jgi:hypothetical protein
VVILGASTGLERIAKFNRRFVPEQRLSNIDFLAWKYRTQKSDSTNITEHYGILNDENELAGQISVQPMQAWINGQWQQCNYLVDWYRDPAYPGSGVRLLNHIMQRKPSLLATGASDIGLKIFERRKMSLLPIDHRFVYVSRPLVALIRAATTPRRAAGIFLRWSKKPATRAAKVSLEPGYQFSEEKSVDPDLLVGWESDLPPDTIFVRREKWLLSWFLETFPFTEFRLVVLSFKGKQIGYVLLHARKTANNIVEGKIVDLFARGWIHDHLAALFREGMRVLSKQGVHIIKYHATHPVFISLAQDGGFKLVRTQPVVAYGPIADALVSGRHSIHMTYYDQDEAYY